MNTKTKISSRFCSKNTFIIGRHGVNSVRLISKGEETDKICLFDEDEMDFIGSRTWHLLTCKCKNGEEINYAVTYTTKRHILMHREITEAPKGKVVDHINHNGLDNRKSNLRVVTQSENLHNSLKHKKIKHLDMPMGVYKRNNRYVATIKKVKNKQLWLGTFDTPQQAGQAYLSFKKNIIENL